MTVFRFLLFLTTIPVLSAILPLVPFPQVQVRQYPTSSPNPKNDGVFRASDGSSWKILPAGASRDSRPFQGKRFLPCDKVTGFSEPTPGRVRVHTSCGDSEIWFQSTTLALKAKHYDAIARRHARHGFIADTKGGQLASNDNDGLWTAMYASAKLFEYKSTGNKQALSHAEEATRAVLTLEKITGIPGYPARSYVSLDEPQPKDGFWYPSADGKFRWKSDTSSDEIVGHFLLFSVAWDLLPPGPLRDEVQATCRRMIDYILKNNYTLIDRTGKPTRWGRWSPEYFNGEGRGDSPLNSIELMSFLTTAHHVTGDPRYGRELSHVAEDLGYLKISGELALRRDELNYSDEELALLSFYPLLLHSKNSKYHPAYLKALDDWFVNIRREKNPLWNTIYEVTHGEDKQLRADSVATLQRLPLDLRHWTIQNSWRQDLPLDPKPDRFHKPQTTTWLPPDERPVMKWNGNPFVLDGGNDGQSEDDGTIFLLPYWMGRFHKLWGER